VRARRSYQSPHSREAVDLGRLREILLARRGVRAAIRARDLATLLGLGHRDGYPERSVRGAVNILIGEGLAVGSTVSEPYGYFLIETEEELRRCVANYVARAREIQNKAEALVEAYRRGPAQPSLLAAAPDADRPGAPDAR
jgi:hypothetical protein